MFMQGDIVYYVGNKPSANKGGRGEVLTRIANEEGMYVVEFGVEAYVLPEASLTKQATPQALAAAAKETEVVQKKRRRSSADEE